MKSRSERSLKTYEIEFHIEGRTVIVEVVARTKAAAYALAACAVNQQLSDYFDIHVKQKHLGDIPF